MVTANRAAAITFPNQVATPQPPTPQTSNKPFWKKKLPSLNNQQQRHEISGQVALLGSVLAVTLAAVSQQAMFAVPLSLAVGLSLSSRQRFEQQTQQHLKTAMTQLAQIQADVQPLVNYPLASSFSSLQQRVETLEKAELEGKLTNLQQWVSDLDASADALHDRTRHLDAWEKQLVALQERISNQYKSDRRRVAIFIDGTSLSKAATKLGIEIDYSNLLSFLTGDSPLFRAYYYMGVDGTQQQQNFITLLHSYGYRVVTKKIVRRADGSTKANLDVEIALDMVSLVSSYDTAVLVGVNDDLACAIKAISSRGARVEVVGWQSSQTVELIDEADNYLDLRATNYRRDG